MVKTLGKAVTSRYYLSLFFFFCMLLSNANNIVMQSNPAANQETFSARCAWW